MIIAKNQTIAVLVGAGDRVDIYISVSKKHPDKLKIVGVVEHNPVSRIMCKG